MQYRKFGGTGIEISALGFGAMRLPVGDGDGGNAFDVEEGVRVIRRAFELGVNYIDTAPYYCGGESEVIVGKALKGWRDRVYLSTKNPVEDGSGEHWRERLEKSLRKLDADYVDFYHMWGISWDTYVKSIDVRDGPLEAARRAKEEGLIKHISFSFHDAAENMVRLIDTGNFETVLCQYNLLDRSNEKAIAHAREKGLGVVVMGPVGGGRLGAPSGAIQSLIPGKSSSSAEIALRFVLANPDVTCALSGMGSVRMVEENAGVASNETPLTEEEFARIKASMEEKKRMADLYCTGCNYCMPCPTGVNIPLNFQVMNNYRVYDIHDFARNQYRQIGEAEWMKGKKAEECIECGICEEKCPQKIEIRRQLKEVARTLG